MCGTGAYHGRQTSEEEVGAREYESGFAKELLIREFVCWSRIVKKR